MAQPNQILGRQDLTSVADLSLSPLHQAEGLGERVGAPQTPPPTPPRLRGGEEA